VSLRFQRPLAAALAAFLAAPGASLATPIPATVSGSLLSSRGAPLASAELVFVNLDSGLLTTASTNERGLFEARVAPGIYSMVPRDARIVSGPRVVSARAGQRLEASLIVEAIAAPIAAAAPTVALEHAPIGCFTAEQFGEVAAVITPASDVAEARVYFRAHWENEFHYVPMVPEVGRHVACLPRPRRDASPVYYFLEVQAKDGTLLRTAEFNSLVVPGAAECPRDLLLAVVCRRTAGMLTTPPVEEALAALPQGLVGNLPAVMVVGATAIGMLMIMQRLPNASASR